MVAAFILSVNYVLYKKKRKQQQQQQKYLLFDPGADEAPSGKREVESYPTIRPCEQASKPVRFPFLTTKLSNTECLEEYVP